MDKELDWGGIEKNEWFLKTVKQEIFEDNIYQQFFNVEPGDIVLDVGASIGPFGWSILPAHPSRLICLEPNESLFGTLTKNLSDVEGVTLINKGISSIDGKTYLTGLFNENTVEISDGSSGEMIPTTRFDTLIKEKNISKIDFLKTDCEGGEYDIFNDANLEWILSNVKKVAGEFHLHTATEKAKFRKFRDTYLTKFTNFRIFSMDNVDIAHSLWSDWFLDYYSAIMVYIDNRNIVTPPKPTPSGLKKWQKYPAPTLEITTIIPEKGCIVDCAFCPQRVLEKVYSGTRILTLENFKYLIDKVPTDVRVTFAGFTEPWMNKYCTDMVLYAHEKGHPISVFTTGIGLSIEDLERMIDIPFAGNPNGGFTFHLPDAEMLARHPITPGYISMLTWLKENNHRIKNFGTMSMGAVHPEVSHLFAWAQVYTMWSRGGNLIRESLLKPGLINLKDRWNSVYNGPDPKTCNCVEHLYHNVLLPNGSVSLCCMDYGLEHILGNLYDKSYEDIIPETQSCFELCNFCENATDPKTEKPIKWFSKNKT